MSRPVRIYQVCLIGLLLMVTAWLTGCDQVADDSADQPSLAGVELVDLVSGESASLDGYRGRHLILNVWAPWCAPCLDEMPSLERLSQRLDPNRFAVIGVTADEKFLAQEFLLKHKITFRNFFDADRGVIEGVLDVKAFPETVIIGTDGRLIERLAGWRDWESAEIRAMLDQL